MEPSEEFCVSGCTCTFSLGPGSVVEEKVKKGGNSKKKKKDKTRKEKKKQTKTTTTTTTTTTKTGVGCGKGQQKKKNCRPQLPTFLSFPPLHLLYFFFSPFPFCSRSLCPHKESFKENMVL